MSYSFQSRNTSPVFMPVAAVMSLMAVTILLFNIALAAVLCVIPWLVVLFYRHPIVLLCLWPIGHLVDVFVEFQPLRAGGVRLLPMDPIYFFTIAHLAVCAFMHPKKTASILKENKFLLIFVVMVALSVVVYSPIYGQSAVGEARKFYFIFLFPLLAMVTIKGPGDIRRFLCVVVGMALVIAVFAFARAAMTGSIVRVLNADRTLILGLVAFALVLLRINKVVLVSLPVDTALLSVFSFVVLVSSQRSVMLGVGVGSMLLLWLYRHRAVFMFKAFMAIAYIVLGMTVAIIAFPQAGSKLTEKLAGILDPYSDKTAVWRIKGWEAQLKTIREGNPLIGEGLGGYYSWKLGRAEIKASPHNAYIQLMLKFGLMGLLIYGLLLAEFFRKTLVARKKLPPGAIRAFMEMGVVCFGAGHGYMLGYGFQPIILIFLGVALSAVKLYQQELKNYRALQVRALGRDTKISSARVAEASGMVPRTF